jgi:hypothetical protein
MLALRPHQMRRRTLLLIIALILTGSANAFGFEVVLTNELERAKITIAEVPDQRDALVVAWQGVPGVTPATGAMVYYRDRSSSELRYFAIGGGGRFSIIDRGSSRRFRGTASMVVEVVSDDPKHPLVFVGDTRQTVDVAALLAQYAAFENIAAPSETRAAIESAIAAKATQTNRACGSRLAPKLAWKTFATPASLRLAKQAVSILESIEAICSDKDYAEAVRGLRELQVDYQADGGALRLEKTSAALVVRFSDTSFNPRETARLWLRDHL